MYERVKNITCHYSHKFTVHQASASLLVQHRIKQKKHNVIFKNINNKTPIKCGTSHADRTLMDQNTQIAGAQKHHSKYQQVVKVI